MPTPSSTRQTRFLLLLSLGHFLTDVNQGGLPFLLPLLKDAYHLTYASVGVVLMVANLTSSVIQPLFGLFSDRSQRRILLPVGVFLASLGTAAVGWAPGYWPVLLAVVVSGLGIASYHPEASRVVYHLAGARRATGTALFSVGGNLGFAFGPVLLAFLIAHFGLRGTGWMVLPGLGMGLVLFGLLPRIARREATSSGHFQRSRDSLPATNWRAESLLIALVAVRSWIQFGLVSFIPFYYINYLKGDPSWTSYLLFAFLASGAVGTLAGGPAADRWGSRPLLLISMAVLFPVLLLLLHSHGWQTLVLLAVGGFALVSTFTITLVLSQDFMPRNLGLASGLNIGFSIGMGGIGVTLLGVIADAWGVPRTLEAMVVLPVLGFVLAALVPTAAQAHHQVEARSA